MYELSKLTDVPAICFITVVEHIGMFIGHSGYVADYAERDRKMIRFLAEGPTKISSIISGLVVAIRSSTFPLM